MQERVKRISAFEKATQMEILRKDDAESDQILEKPFLSNSMPSPKSPKLSGAGMQFRTVPKIILDVIFIDQSVQMICCSVFWLVKFLVR
jgi:hypothetical protein